MRAPEAPTALPAVHQAEVLFSCPDTWERLPPWPSTESRLLQCCAVTDETHDVKSFTFRQPDAAPVAFMPGQFITVRATVNGLPLMRCYTISSSPARPFTISITVKKVSGGTLSNWLHAHLHVGATLEAFGPAGMFTPAPGQRSKLLYMSAGSGVTPLMAMTRAGHDLGLDRDIVFVHSARTPADIVFRQELIALQSRLPGLQVMQVCESKGDAPDWQGPVGRLSLELLQRLVPDFSQREVFTCGPAGYMQATQELLLRGGHPAEHYHQESFDLGSTTAGSAEAVAESLPSSTASAAPPIEAASFSVTLAKSKRTITVSGAHMLLASLRRAGVPVPSSCGQGLCGTCKTPLLQGQVTMAHQGGIRQREIDKGLRLLCCSRPESDLVLEL